MRESAGVPMVWRRIGLMVLATAACFQGRASAALVWPQGDNDCRTQLEPIINAFLDPAAPGDCLPNDSSDVDARQHIQGLISNTDVYIVCNRKRAPGNLGITFVARPDGSVPVEGNWDYELLQASAHLGGGTSSRIEFNPDPSVSRPALRRRGRAVGTASGLTTKGAESGLSGG